MADVEKSLLSCLIKKGDLIKEVAISDKHFESLEHQRIFTAMRSLEQRNEPIDIVSLTMELGQDILLSGGRVYLADLHNMITDLENFKTYEKYVLNEYKIRTAKQLAKGMDEMTSAKDIEKLQDLINEVNNLLETAEEKEFNIIETLVEINEDVEKVKEGINGIPTGYTDLDIVLDGLGEEELIILAARPSVGKTAFALGITTNICESNHFVDFFSLEMSAKSLLMRMFSNVANVDSMKLKSAMKRFSSEDWQKYRIAQGKLSSYKENLAIYDESQITLQGIRSKVRRSIRRFPDKRHLVIIDYLTLIKGSGRRERHLEVGEISRGLKRMSRDLKVPVILLAQLNRGVEQRQDKRPMLSDLRDSGEIEQDADKILFLHRDDYYDKETENKNIIDIIVSKNRNGSLGTVNLAFVKEYQKFVNLKRRYDG